MSIDVSFNGQTYTIPEVDDNNWGDGLTDYFTAIPQGCLQKVGGTFTLTADVNFGATFGLVSTYFKSRTANIATAGALRLAVTDVIDWRNNANSANLSLGVNGSDQLTFGGSAIYTGGITALTGDVTATGPGSVAATIANNAVSNAKFRQSAALSVVGNATNATANVADITAGTDGFILGRSGTSLAFALLVNANVSASAAIARSKLASGTNYRILANSSAGVMSENAALTASQLITGDANGQLQTLAAGSQYQVLVMGAANPGYGQVNLAQSAAITGALPLGNGGTGATTKAAAFDALSPMSAGGDLIYGGASGTGTRLPNGTAGQVLTSAGTTSAPTWSTVVTGSYLTTTSSVLTPGASDSGKFLAMTSNSVTQPANTTYEYTGTMSFSNSGSPGYTEVAAGWYGANGTGTASLPTALTCDSPNPIYDTQTSSVGVVTVQLPRIQVTTAGSTQAVFLVGNALMGTPTAARWTAYVYGNRLK